MRTYHYVRKDGHLLRYRKIRSRPERLPSADRILKDIGYERVSKATLVKLQKALPTG